MPPIASIPGTQSGGGGDGLIGGFNNLPTMVKIGVIGGGVGLAVFLYNRQKAGGSSSSNSASFGLPNTAIMLGSLQQGQLDLKGQVGSSYNDLSNQMASDTSQIQDNITGSTETLGQTLDMMSKSFTDSFANLQSNLTASQVANTQSILNAIGASTQTLAGDLAQRSDLLTQLIQGNDSAIAAALNSISQSQAAGFNQVTAQQNAEAAVIGALGNNVNSGQAAIISQLNQMQAGDIATTGTITSQLTSLGNFLGWQFYQIPNRYAAYIPGQGPGTANPMGGNVNVSGLFGPTNPTFNWGALNGRVLFSSTDNSYYSVNNGTVGVITPGQAQQMAGDSGAINTSLSLRNVIGQ